MNFMSGFLGVPTTATASVTIPPHSGLTNLHLDAAGHTGFEREIIIIAGVPGANHDAVNTAGVTDSAGVAISGFTERTLVMDSTDSYKLYQCTDPTATAAVWAALGGGGGASSLVDLNSGFSGSEYVESSEWSNLGATGEAGTPLSYYLFDNSADELKNRVTPGTLDLVIDGSFTGRTNFKGIAPYYSTSRGPRYRTANGTADNNLLEVEYPWTMEVVFDNWADNNNSYLIDINAVDTGNDNTNRVLGLAAVNGNAIYRSWQSAGQVDRNVWYDVAALKRPQYVAMTLAADGVTSKVYINGLLMQTDVAATSPTLGDKGTQNVYMTIGSDIGLTLEHIDIAIREVRWTPNTVYSAANVLSAWKKLIGATS